MEKGGLERKEKEPEGSYRSRTHGGCQTSMGRWEVLEVLGAQVEPPGDPGRPWKCPVCPAVGVVRGQTIVVCRVFSLLKMLVSRSLAQQRSAFPSLLSGSPICRHEGSNVSVSARGQGAVEDPIAFPTSKDGQENAKHH